jgi:hypothetical protein
MWCVFGHQVSISLVNTRKAFSTLARTVTVLTTGANAVSGIIFFCFLDFLFECVQRQAPELLEIIPAG